MLISDRVIIRPSNLILSLHKKKHPKSVQRSKVVTGVYVVLDYDLSLRDSTQMRPSPGGNTHTTAALCPGRLNYQPRSSAKIAWV